MLYLALDHVSWNSNLRWKCDWGTLHHRWPLPGHLGSLQRGSERSGSRLSATSSSADHQGRRKLLQGAPLILLHPRQRGRWIFASSVSLGQRRQQI
ncbi:WAT1-related protein [Zea mays]|uniref:WAT1-related protein n=1 Tax=Zea mays TaxID=4577 RepID=A0A1D6LN74_MAIZE|nr:WAT1-related protein [Zea mays]